MKQQTIKPTDIHIEELEKYFRCFECHCYPCDITCSFQGTYDTIHKLFVNQALANKLNELLEEIDEIIPSKLMPMSKEALKKEHYKCARIYNKIIKQLLLKKFTKVK